MKKNARAGDYQCILALGLVKLRFQNLEKKIPLARKLFGGYVAHGILTPENGLVTTPNQSGHFDLHEYKDSTLSFSFTIHSEIPRL